MVKLDEVRDGNKSLVQKQPLVAVFFSTGGIAHQTIRALSTASANGGKGFRAYIVGRKSKPAEEIIADCRGIYPQAQFTFIKADDLSLIRDVDRAFEEIIQLEEKKGQDAKIDYLMMAQGGSIFLPRIGTFYNASISRCVSNSHSPLDTKEGIDQTMSLMYYSRMRIITKLLPLLLRSTLPATVVSVYAAGMEEKLFPEDLSLRDPKHYSYSQARSHMVYMHTLFMEVLAEQNRGKLALIHVFPGLVIGPGFKNPELPTWFRIIFPVVIAIFGRFITVKPSECGERMLSLASRRYPPRPVDGSTNREGAVVGTDRKTGSGAYSLTWNGEDSIKAQAYEKFDKDEMRKRVWDHTMKAFEVIEAGNVFAE